MSRRPTGAQAPAPLGVRVCPPEEAVAHLRASDARLRKYIDVIGPCMLVPSREQTPFEALARAIIYQQLSGKAAGTIFGRVKALFPRGRLRPALLLAMDDETLRGAGVSRGKLAALRDLARHTEEGTVPSWRKMASMDEEALIERLCAVRGVGRWTVEMLLIFRLGRPDVLPLTDLGVRKGAARLDGQSELPSPEALTRRAARWRPYRSVASWYLWRIAELPSSGRG